MTWDRVVQRHAGVGVRQRAVPDDPVWTELYVLTLCVNLDTFNLVTVGADKNETLVFVHFSAQGASISIISVAIM